MRYQNQSLFLAACLLAIIACGSFPARLAAQTTTTKFQYIEKYKELAISEMERSGIPASITLAQGIVESNSSNSKLAREACNHFGIKCGTEWTGETYPLEDDDYDSQGNLLKSCFRKYKRPEESYLDHTDYLMGKQRYQSLFSLATDDYKGWATGLKAAGYATNPKYADILIKTVEDNKLTEFDKPRANAADILITDTGKKIRNPFSVKKDEKGVFKNNTNKTVIAKPGETLLEIATRYDKPYSKMLAWNDLKPNDPLYASQFVYLESKCSRFKGNKKVHVVAEGENMYIISQLYGIELDDLYQRNNLKAPAEPAVGARLALSGNTKAPVKLQDSKTPKTLLPINGKENAAPANPDAPKKAVAKESLQYNKVIDLLEEFLKLKTPAVKVENTPAPTPTTPPVVNTPTTTPPATPTTPPVVKPENTLPKPSPESSQPKPPVKSQPAIVPDVPRNPSPTPVLAPKAAAAAGTHIVEVGETFFAIAKKYNTTVANLKRLNGFDDNENAISVGQVLKVR